MNKLLKPLGEAKEWIYWTTWITGCSSLLFGAGNCVAAGFIPAVTGTGSKFGAGCGGCGDSAAPTASATGKAALSQNGGALLL